MNFFKKKLQKHELREALINGEIFLNIKVKTGIYRSHLKEANIYLTSTFSWFFVSKPWFIEKVCNLDYLMKKLSVVEVFLVNF